MKKGLLSAVCASAVLLGTLSVCAQGPEAPLPAAEVPPHHEMVKGPRPGEMPRPPHMKKMKEDLGKKLGLTEEQEEQARKIREEGREKMKPLMEEQRELHKKMNEIRKENMAEFEEILTPEQKQKFSEIKKEMESRRPFKKRFGPKDKGGFVPEKADKK